MIHPDTELRFIHPKIGFGVVATAPIPKGSITWVQDELDQVLTPQAFNRLGNIYADVVGKYSFVNVRGDYVLCWDLARFINHSCAPNCLSAGYNFEIAVRDILPGEQLTDDYATLNLEDRFECHCRTAECRGMVSGDDIHFYADRWDRQVRAAFAHIAQQPQPLWPLVEEKDAVLAALHDASQIASCRVNLRGFEGSPSLA